MQANDEYTQLRFEAFQTASLLIAENKGVVPPESILHLGMFFGMTPSHFPSAEELAEKFHTTYERLAPEYSYKTREASAKPWSEVPEQNKRLMIATCREILKTLR